jgi:hypothetical protein
MDYQKIYNTLCTNSFNRINTENVTERHHIVPKCMGGTDSISNIAILTPKEHFIAHKLLCEIYPNNSKLSYALWAMMNLNNRYQDRKYTVSSREYERMRNIYVKLQMKPKSDETKQKMRLAATNRKIIKCPHCDMISKSVSNMNRYHFNKCKYSNMEMHNV